MPAEIVELTQNETCAGCGKPIEAGEQAREYPNGKYYHLTHRKEVQKPASRAAATSPGRVKKVEGTALDTYQLLAQKMIMMADSFLSLTEVYRELAGLLLQRSATLREPSPRESPEATPREPPRRRGASE